MQQHRRALLGSIASVGLAPWSCVRAQSTDALEMARAQLLDLARRQLATGEADAALETSQRVALMRHTADSELAIARALMAAGRYRQALAASAHTAGAHREESAGLMLYAWLLRLAGQQPVSLRLLDDALRQAPSDAMLRSARDQLAGDWPLASALPERDAAGASPPAVAVQAGDAPPAGVRTVGTASLLRGGHEALVLRTLVADGQPVWLRNGLGQSVRVVARRTLSDPELDVMTLRSPLPAPLWPVASREPFAGSPGSLVEYVPDPDGRPAWPLLRQGFFAGVPASGPSRPLGIDAPRGLRGGPVFDGGARFVGIAAPAEPDQLIGLGRLRAALGAELLDADAGGNAVGVGLDLVYEQAMRGVLQVVSQA